jgi:hypothetical protein
MGQHIRDTDAPEFLICLAYDNDVSLQATSLEDAFERFEQSGHSGLCVTRTTAQEMTRFDDRIEGVDHHSVDWYGVEMAGHEQCFCTGVSGGFSDDAGPPCPSNERAIQPQSRELMGNVFRDGLLSSDLHRQIVPTHRVDRGNRDHLAQISNAG